MNQEPQVTFTPTKSLLYWRKSKLNGAACVPVIISLDEAKNLSLKTTSATEFSVPVSQTAVKFTNWGTMVITINGKTYDIVGSGAGTSPRPTAEQLKEINEDGGTNSTENATLGTVGAVGVAASAIDAGAGVAGSAAMQYVYYKGLEAIKAWQELLPKAGATVQTSKMNAMKYFTLAVAVLVVLALIIGLSAKK